MIEGFLSQIVLRDRGCDRKYLNSNSHPELETALLRIRHGHIARLTLFQKRARAAARGRVRRTAEIQSRLR